MRKEVLFAILAGVSIGLIIAFGAWRVTQSIKRMSQPVVENKKKEQSKNQISLSISNLYDYDIVTDDPIKITGLTKPQSIVVVSTTTDDFFTKSNDEGVFEVEVSLPAGLSEIILRESQSKDSFQKMVLVYSTEFKKYIDIDKDNGKTHKTTAYVGTITDISSGAIQIKTNSGDIKQMSTTEETSYINTLKKNTEIKLTDLAIGDYIVSMGFLNGNKVLDSKRILVTSPLAKNTVEIISGTINTLSKTKITIDKDNGETEEITLPKKWNGPNINELEKGQKIIFVGTRENEKYTTRTIFSVVE